MVDRYRAGRVTGERATGQRATGERIRNGRAPIKKTPTQITTPTITKENLINDLIKDPNNVVLRDPQGKIIGIQSKPKTFTSNFYKKKGKKKQITAKYVPFELKINPDGSMIATYRNNYEYYDRKKEDKRTVNSKVYVNKIILYNSFGNIVSSKTFSIYKTQEQDGTNYRKKYYEPYLRSEIKGGMQYSYNAPATKQKTQKEPEKVIPTRLKLNGKVIVGVVDSRGKFIPSSSDANTFRNVAKSPRGNLITNYEQLQQKQYTQQIQKLKADLQTKQAQQIKKSFEDAGLGFVAKVYTPKQQEILMRTLTTISPTKLKEIDKIDKSPTLNDFQKEEAKRKYLGIDKEFGILTEAQKTVKQLRAEMNARNIKLSKLIAPNEQEKIYKKVLLGESLTPNETEQYFIMQRLQKQANDKTQNEQIKTFLASPFNYGRSLVIRYQAGDKNPLLTDVKSIGYGFGDEIWKMTAEPIIGAFKYGWNVSEEANKQGIKVQDVFKKDINNVINTIRDVSKFAKANKVTTAIVIATAIDEGMSGSYAKAKKNKLEYLGRAIAWLNPSIVFKALKVDKYVHKGISKVLTAEKYSKNTFKVSSQLETGASKINGEISGILRNKKSFTTNYKLKYNPNTKTYKGTAITKYGDKVIKQELELVDKGTYFQDIKTGDKISKIKAPIKEQSLKVKETTITPKTKEAKISGNIAGIIETAEIKTIVTTIANKLKTITTRLSGVAKVTDTKTRKVIKGVGTQLSKIRTKKKTKIGESLSMEQINQLEKFLKSIQYDEVILSGLDKRTRLARALGLQKSNKIIKAIQNIVDKNGNVYKTIITSAKLKQRGEIIKGIKPKPTIKFSEKIIKFIDKRRGGVPLRQSKKGVYNIVPKNEIKLLKKTKKDLYRPSKTITIPELKSKIPLTKFNLVKLNVFTRLVQVGNLIKKIDSLIKLDNINKLNEINRNIIKLKEIVREVQKEIQIQERIKKLPVPVKKLKSKAELQKITQIKEIPKSPKIPKPPRARKKHHDDDDGEKDFELDLTPITSPKLTNRVLVFEGKYRERLYPMRKAHPKLNPVVTKTKNIKTTRNRAYKIYGDLADTKAIRSIKVQVVGVTSKKIKDIKKPKVLSKFRQKKASKSPVLELVEKSKYTLDSPTEKQELRQARRRKKKTPVKRKVATRTTTKKKTAAKKPTKMRAVKKKSPIRKQKKVSKPKKTKKSPRKAPKRRTAKKL